MLGSRWRKGEDIGWKKNTFPNRKKNKTTKKTVLSRNAFDLVLRAAETIEATDAYKWLKEHDTRSQTILTGSLAGSPIKGKLDWLTLDDSVAYITDLKTTTNIHPTKIYYHVLDYQYHIQMALYRELVFQNYPQIQAVAGRHLVVTRTDWPQVATFNFHKDFLKKGLLLATDAIEGIAAGRFEELPVSWETANMLEDKYALPTSEGDIGEE